MRYGKTPLLGLSLGLLCVAALPWHGAAQGASGVKREYVGTEICQGCHPDQYDTFAATKMGQLFLKAPKTAAEKLGCEGCHGPGSAHVDADGKKPGLLLDYGKKDATPVAVRSRFDGSWRASLAVQAASRVLRPACTHAPRPRGAVPAVQPRVTRGDALTGMRRFTAAVHEYRIAADIVRRQGHLPSFTLWHLASAYYYQGDPQRAAVVLEQLSAEAAQCGDLAVQAPALFNAAWLNGEGGRGQVAATEIADLSKLLRSPYMPVAVRDHLTARLNPPSAVAVDH